MRTAFINTLTGIMRKDKTVITITADMGYSVFESLQKEFPKRFFNTGVTEQSSIGIASGFALSGFTVFFYAQAPFATMRCFEQIHLDIAYTKANVKIVGTAAGFSSNQLGTSHFALEDVALMRVLPNMTVLSPGDPVEATWATQIAYKTKGPFYLRIGKNEPASVNKENQKIILGKGNLILNGNDVAILATGSMLQTARVVSKQLENDGISVALISFPTIKPIDKAMIIKLAKKTKLLITIEEHSIIGGLGSAVAEIIAQQKANTKLLVLGVKDAFIDVTGSIEYLRNYTGISEKKIISSIKKELLSLKNF